jgi:homospermidine synthase
MSDDTIYAGIPERLVLLGFGSIGQACLPLLLRHLEIDPDRIIIIAADGDGAEVARHFNVGHRVHRLTADNYREVVAPLLERGGFLLNLSVDVSSKALIELAQECGALYLDTCTEPWAGSYLDPSRSLSERSNYALREEVLALREDRSGEPTAVMTMGANPGLASVFVKTALLRMAADNGVAPRPPTRHVHWAELARDIGIKAIHIAERDTQVTGSHKKRGEFVNTWSVSGFVSEGLQPAELGWGSHERHWPEDAARHGYGSDAAIYLGRPGCSTRVRSWTPLEGPYVGFLITHAESISIADHLTVSENGKVIYRPTVHYAYHPCDDAVLSLHELAGKRWKQQDTKHIVRDEITSGMDELGVLLMGNRKGPYWFGSRLSIEQARALAPFNNATSMQVVAGILGGMVWAIKNPRRGIVEPDDIPYQEIMEVATPYLGDVVGIYGDWDPLQDRETLFKEDLDREDPWQFKNVRVM